MTLKFLARALWHRNFRLFVAGQSLSLIGTWMQQAAMTWLVYRLTHSPSWLGVVGFSAQVPILFLAPWAGVVADRWPRRRILLLTQSLAMLQAWLLVILVLTGRVAVGHLVLLSLFLGLVQAFDMTVRQAFLADLVAKKEDLASAIALNSAMINCARLLGPAAAGLLIAVAGEGICFLLNGISYLAVLAALLAISLETRPVEAPRRYVLQDLREGLTYAFGLAPIRSVLLLLALVSLAGMPYAWLLPIFARDILGGGPQTFGLLMAASGLGALMGALSVAPRTSIAGLGRRIALASGGFGIGLIGFSCSRVVWLSWALLFATGFAWTVQLACSNTVLLTLVAEDKRGRVMSFYTMAFLGTTPLGTLLAGHLAGHIGAPKTLILGGLCCLCGSLLLAGKLPP
jgi:MFS family permease